MKHKPSQLPGCYLAAFVALSATSLAVQGAFVNGVDNFSGTTLDTATWQTKTLGSSQYTQNNSLTIDSSHDGSFTDYTTKTQTVAVGQQASIRVKINAYNPDAFDFPAYVDFYLTNNSEGTMATSNSDSYFMAVDNEDGLNSGINTKFSSNAHGFGHSLQKTLQPVGSVWTWDIARLDASTARFSIYDQNDMPLDSYVMTLTGDASNHIAPNPDPLYISMFVEGASATFNDVSITLAPEPASALLAAAPILLSIVTRGRRRLAPSLRSTAQTR